MWTYYFECAVLEFFRSFHPQPVCLGKTNAVLDEYLTQVKGMAALNKNYITVTHERLKLHELKFLKCF